MLSTLMRTQAKHIPFHLMPQSPELRPHSHLPIHKHLMYPFQSQRYAFSETNLMREFFTTFLSTNTSCTLSRTNIKHFPETNSMLEFFTRTAFLMSKLYLHHNIAFPLPHWLRRPNNPQICTLFCLFPFKTFPLPLSAPDSHNLAHQTQSISSSNTPGLPSRNPFGDNNDINFTDINASMRKPPLQYPVMPPLTTFPCRQSRPTTRKRKPPTCGTNPRKKMRKQYPTLKDELGENEGNF